MVIGNIISNLSSSSSNSLKRASITLKSSLESIIISRPLTFTVIGNLTDVQLALSIILSADPSMIDVENIKLVSSDSEVRASLSSG